MPRRGLRVQSEFAAPKHGSETSMVKGYGYDRFPIDGELGVFMHGGPSERPESTVVGNMLVGPVIEKALSLPEVTDFNSDETVTTGHHYKTILGLAPEILAAIQGGKLKQVFVVAGWLVVDI